MRKFSAILWLGFLFFLCVECGRKGPLEKPVPRVPVRVENFEARQRGNKIYFSWTDPETDLRGNELGLVRAEIRVLELKESAGNKEGYRRDFLKYSRPVETVFPGDLALSRGRAVLTLDLKKTTGLKFLFGLRVRGTRGGWSDVSNLVEIEVLPVTEPPGHLEVEMKGQSVLVQWKAPEKMADGRPVVGEPLYNIYRSENGEFKKLNSFPLGQTFFEDREARPGFIFRYLVRALLPSYSEVESDDSEMVTVTVPDRTPPARPEGLQGFYSSEGVVLSWLPNREEDLAGYRVYRAREGEKEIILTPEPIRRTNYVDSSVEKNRLYEYSITAVDKSQNESSGAKIKVKT